MDANRVDEMTPWQDSKNALNIFSDDDRDFVARIVIRKEWRHVQSSSAIAANAAINKMIGG